MRAAPELCEVTVQTPFRTTDSDHLSTQHGMNTDHMTLSRLHLTPTQSCRSRGPAAIALGLSKRADKNKHLKAQAFVVTFIYDICSPVQYVVQAQTC